MNSRIRVTRDDVAKVLQSISELTKARVLVGVPDTSADRRQEEGEPINNAALAYIHEHGAPAANIPARPFLIPGVQDVQDKVADRLKVAGQAALAGDSERVERQLYAAGMLAQNSARDKISDGDFAPLKDSTLRARAAKGREGAKEELASRAAGNPPNPENARPLIDTGQLRNSITFAVRKT